MTARQHAVILEQTYNSQYGCVVHAVIVSLVASGSLYVPVTDLGPQFVVGSPRDRKTNVTRRELDGGRIVAGNGLYERAARFRRNESVVTTQHVQDWHPDVVDIDAFAVQPQVSRYQLILLVQVHEELAIYLAGNVDSIERPMETACEMFDERLVVKTFEKPKIPREVEFARVS